MTPQLSVCLIKIIYVQTHRTRVGKLHSRGRGEDPSGRAFVWLCGNATVNPNSQDFSRSHSVMGFTNIWEMGLDFVQGSGGCSAANQGYEATVRLLLEKGESLEFQGHKFSYTPLLEAVKGGYIEIVRFLIDCGADFKRKDDEYSKLPLSIAVQRGNMELVELLLEKGANL